MMIDWHVDGLPKSQTEESIPIVFVIRGNAALLYFSDFSCEVKTFCQTEFLLLVGERTRHFLKNKTID